LKQRPYDQSSNSLLYRFARTSEIINRIDEDKLPLGYGPATSTQESSVYNMEITTHDLVWTGVVFRWGFIGLVLFVLLYLVSIFKAFSLFIKRDDILSKLALLFLLVIVSQFIESFISSTFLSSDRYAMGLWYIAILSSLLLADKNYSDSTTKEQNHE